MRTLIQCNICNEVRVIAFLTNKDQLKA